MSQLEEILKMLPVAMKYANENLDAINRVRQLALTAIKQQELTGGKTAVLASAILEALDGEQL